MIDNKNVLAIIPARGGSKGIPNKNIKLMNGKPLIYYTISEAKKCKYFDKIVVSTDSVEIKKISEDFGAYVPVLRPKELASDSSPTIDSILHMLKWLEINENFRPDYICVLQCTSPLRNVEDIEKAIKKLNETNFDAVVSVSEIKENPYLAMELKNDRLSYIFKEGKKVIRRQELPLCYEINGAIYAIKYDALINYKTLEPENLGGIVIPKEKSIDIDDIIDFKLAELLLKERSESDAKNCSSDW